MKKLGYILFSLCVLSLSSRTHPEVEAPNYNFSLDAFEQFKPGSSLDEIKKKYPKAETIEQKLDTLTLKVYVAHLRYKFPAFVQFYQGKSLDFFARLPSYFSHDLFHYSLIKRYGKQELYAKKEESALYVWKGEKDGIKKIYNGTCTITCFPIYFTQISNAVPKEYTDYHPLYEKLNSAIKGKDLK